MKRKTSYRQRGYTLIELLLYVAIVGALLTSVTYFFGTVTEARVKNQTILEVDEEGASVMDYITQTIRNATSITSPATGTSSAGLTLVVPTGSLSPTVFSGPGAGTAILGYNTPGTTTDSDGNGYMNGTKFVAPASGTVTALNAYISLPLSASPNNKGQMAIYSGASSPSALLASSASVTLTGNAWNTFPISSVSVTSGQTYWLMYNANGTAITDNNMTYHAGATNQAMFKLQTYGTWAASWTGTTQNLEFAQYATIATGGGGGTTLQIQEGAGALTSLTSNDVVMSNLTFKNLSRASTPGVVQVSFTLARVNTSGKNEYDYQKTFTGTAEITW